MKKIQTTQNVPSRFSNPGLEANDIEAVERVLGIKLPNAYRNFIHTNNGIEPKFCSVTEPSSGEFLIVRRLFPLISENLKWNPKSSLSRLVPSNDYSVAELRRFLENSLLPIGDTEAPFYARIFLHLNDSGAVLVSRLSTSTGRYSEPAVWFKRFADFVALMRQGAYATVDSGSKTFTLEAVDCELKTVVNLIRTALVPKCSFFVRPKSAIKASVTLSLIAEPRENAPAVLTNIASLNCTVKDTSVYFDLSKSSSGKWFEIGSNE